jgi:hypothetical protein
MKARLGFVSNSSSSSFLIYGITKSKPDLKKIMLEKGFKFDEKDRWGFRDLVEEFVGMDAQYPDDDYIYYIGKSWASISDDQTGLQFKQDVEERLKKIFGEDIKCGTLTEAWS